MANVNAALEQAITAAGLAPAPGHPGSIGVRAGYAVELSIGLLEDNKPTVRFAARIDPKVAPAIRDALTKDAKRLVDIPVYPGSVLLDDGVLVYAFPPATLGKLEGRLLDAVDALLAVATSIAPPPPAQCRMCGSDHGAEPRVVHGIVDRLCRPCEAKLVDAARREKEAYDALPLRWGWALAAGAATSFVGAIIWTAMIMIVEYQHVAVAAGIGIGIGVATRYAAGKRSHVVDVITAFGSIASTAGSIFLIVLFASLVEPSMTFAALLTDSAGDLAFAGFAGLFGGITAVRLSESIIAKKKKRI
jgi:hypothetical protein